MSVSFRPVEPDRDAAMLHAWVTHPRSAFWQMSDATPEDVRTAYAGIDASAHHRAWIGSLGGEPLVLAETYDPARSTDGGLVGVPELAEGDLGMHVLVAPPTGPPVAGLTRRLFAAVMRLCLTDLSAARVVVEPDERNAAIARLNAEAGFVVARRLELPGKTAALSFCTPAAFAASPIGALT
ncbi:GNAT family N-acetyltransferase [Alteromonas gracilis]